MRRTWQTDEDEFLKEHYADNFTADLALALNRSEIAVYTRARILGLKKSEEIIRLSGSMSSNHPNNWATRFKKGHVPANKNKKMPPEVYEKSKHTFFQKGNRPHNTREGDGAITKRATGYWYIRIKLGKWRQLHTHTWEQANRPLQKGEMVKFRDGNPDNCSLDNLYLCTRSENMKNNTFHKYPTQVKDAMRTLWRLEKMIRKYEKQHRSSTQPDDRRHGKAAQS
jgi:hypothetical protein